MKLFHPDFDQIDNGFKTSFTFDNEEEEDQLISWLSYMEIDHLRSKIPVITDGKMSHQTCVIIDMAVKTNEEEEEVVEDEVVQVEEETTSKKKKSKKVKEEVALE